ncbi:MAG: ABC transporter ATP-binding protein/permease [Saccharofermentans sp.]|nr:ABC transporter ATP-binding protein/permease [Saccharofermentans sp.]
MGENRRRRMGPRGMTGEKPKDFKGTIRKLLAYMGNYKFAVLVVMIFAVGSTIFNVVGPKILGKATTELFEGLIAKITGTGSIDFDKIAKILLTLLAIYGVSAVFAFVQGWIMTTISQKMSFRLREDINKKIDRMPLSYFEGNTVGDILSRITNDVDTLGQSLNQSITQLITSVCTLVGVLVMMFSISGLMTGLTLIILPVSVVLVSVIVKRSQKYFFAQQQYLGQIDGQIEETFSGHNVVKAFNREDKELEHFCETNEVLYESAWKSMFFSGLMQPIMNFVSNLGYVAVAVSGAMLASAGKITLGDITAFIQYVKTFTQPITQMAQVSNMLQSMAAAAERIFQFLDEPEETPDVKDAIDATGLDGSVSFDHVKFGYNPDKTIIHDFNLDVAPGKMVAIVGPTGAGKTTIVKLLMRFYDVNSGEIRIGGKPITQFKRGEVRENFGMVLQDTWLFHGTIMENIRYGRLDATDEEVVKAARAARADRFIRSLPGGYNMELNEESTNVSQGQKQLLTIARALLADNPILILDEATSSVDTRTEHLIQQAMEELMKGRTSFVIAHRLSTIKNADIILVMRDGDIVEQGNHEELLARDGFYAQLYNAQFEQAV